MRCKDAKSSVIYFRETQKESPIVGKKASAKFVLLFGSDESQADVLKKALPPDSRVVLIRPGKEYEELGDVYTIVPGKGLHYQKMLSSIIKTGSSPDLVVFQWRMVHEFNFHDVNESVERSILPFYHLLKSIIALKARSVKRIIAFYGADDPFMKALGAFGKSASLVWPGLSVTTVGIRAGVKDIADIVKMEIQAEVSGASSEFIYENGTRFSKKMEEILPHQLLSGEAFRKKGTYIITGGAGALGMIAARHLAKSYGSNLVLVGRRAVSAAVEKSLEEINSLGGKALYMSADVGNIDDMKNVVAEAKMKFGKINGVIHAAGNAGESVITVKSDEEFEATLRPKIHGTLAVDIATSDEDLDFFLMYSSISSVLGDFGQCDYSTANGFMDSFALRRESLVSKGARKGRTISLNWPLWREGGMHLGKEGESLYLGSSGMAYLETLDGVAALEHAVSIDQKQMGIIAGDRDKISKILGLAPGNVPDGSNSVSKAALPMPEKKIISNNSVITGKKSTENSDILGMVRDDVRMIISDVSKLSIDSIDDEENFSDMGFDSISLKELAIKLAEKFRVEISPAVFFAHSAVKSISEFLLNEHNESLRSLYETESVMATPVAENVSFALGDDLADGFLVPLSRKKHENQKSTSGAGIRVAIIGMNGRYPGSANMDEFWKNIEEGRDLITEVPEDRWDWREVNGEFSSAENACARWGGFIDGVDRFDSEFFGIPPREAGYMDPQHRLFLETVWKTIEDSGYRASSFSGKRVGVFAGVQFSDYMDMMSGNVEISPHMGTGNAHSMLANRVSYLLNLKGPSESIDTACSSSLVAVNRAVKSIQAGECELAIAGGVTLLLSPAGMIQAGKLGILSPDGRCKTFSRGANGYVKGEGVGAVLLKPLENAIQDGDNIHAVIIASAEAHGGKSNSLTAPNSESQAEMISREYIENGIDPETITFIEAHGTGTELGDPVEVEGLKKAFHDVQVEKGRTSVKHQYCGIGSVKTNIGHLEPAAGIAGITKSVLSMKHGKIPGLVHFDEINPYIDLKNSPFYITSISRDWARLKDFSGCEIHRRTGVSSFGFGGSYAHIVLEEFYLKPSRKEKLEKRLFVFSALNENRLREYVSEMINFLEKRTDVSLLDLSYTSLLGREEMSCRIAVTASSVDELLRSLKCYISGEEDKSLFKGKTSSVSAKYPPKTPGDSVKEIVFSDDEAFLDDLAAQWVQGTTFTWNQLFNSEKPFRISMPSYPFAGDKHWFDSYLKDRVQANEHHRETVTNGSAVGEVNHVRDSEAARKKITGELLTIASEVLGTDHSKIDPAGNLGNYGFDSINLKELSVSIQKSFGVDVPPTVFFSRSTLKELCDYIVEEADSGLIARYSGKISAVNTSSGTGNSPRDYFRKQKNPTLVDSSVNMPNNEPVAIIGISGMYPGSENLEEFWKNLREEKDLITEIPPDRWNWKDFYSEDGKGTNRANSRWGGFIDGIDRFDALFFNISPREAEMMDPQQRLFLETAWKTLEDAGYASADVSGKRVGVFAGVQFTDYQDLMAGRVEVQPQIGTGNAHSIVANRVSYILNLKGPSESIDTACSSSLVAVHRAANSIRNRECEMAIAGGVSLMISPYTYVGAAKLGILSPDGRCKTFDRSANGYVKGEGVGAVLMKPLSKAIEDGDHVYGVIKASGEAHGGRANSLTAPNSDAQSEMLVRIYREANIDPGSVTFIEAHGTGTELGDPVEINGLKKSFGELYEMNGLLPEAGYCGIGSVKTNIGHLEPAAGIAGMTKVILSMRNEVLPGTVHFRDLNPFIELDGTPFYIVAKTKEWERKKDPAGKCIPLRAGISSFGFGGSYAHVVLEEYVDERNADNGKDSDRVIVLSARSEERLKKYAENLMDFLKQKSDERAADIKDFSVLRKKLSSDIAVDFSSQFNIAPEVINHEEKLEEFGTDIVQITGFVTAVNDRLGISLSIRDVHENDSIEKLTRYIIDNYEEKVTEHYRVSLQSFEKKESLKLGDIAYTLSIGRDAMNHRLAVVTDSVTGLINALDSYVKGGKLQGNIHVGNSHEMKHAYELLLSDEKGSGFLSSIIQERDLEKIAKMWVSGIEIGWKSLFKGEISLKRIPLPTYPFARDRYWFKYSVGKVPGQVNSLHPIVDSNSSTLDDVIFKKSFSQGDPVLNGLSAGDLIPCAVFLEMARTAARLAGEEADVLRDIKWINRALISAEKLDTAVFLFRADDSIGFEVACEADNAVYVQGRICPAVTKRNFEKPEIFQFSGESAEQSSSSEFYSLLEASGAKRLEHQRLVRSVTLKDNYLVSELSLPACSSNDFLNAAVFDVLVDLSSYLVRKNVNSNFLEQLPSSIKKMSVFSLPTGECMAAIELMGDGNLNALLTDNLGKILVEIKGLSLTKKNADSALPASKNYPEKTSDTGEHSIIYFSPTWEKASISSSGQVGDLLLFDDDPERIEKIRSRFSPDKKIIVVRPGAKFNRAANGEYEISPMNESEYTELFAELKKNKVPENLEFLWGLSEVEVSFKESERRLTAGIYPIFHITRAVSTLKIKEISRIAVFYNNADPFMESISAYGNSMRLIWPAVSFSAIGVPAGFDISEIALNEISSSKESFLPEIVYNEDKVRHAKKMEELKMENISSSVKKGSIWLITGGAGALGLIAARFLASKYAAKLALLGRSSENERIKREIENLKSLGGEAIYIPADVSDKTDMERVVSEINEIFGPLNGVIHAAGSAGENIVTEKDFNEFSSTLRPKVTGSIAIDAATAGQPLDYFLVYSSTSALLGDFGQCDYAMGNRFMDAYVAHRESLREKGLRSGRSVSVNWPLWREGGMHLSPDGEKLYLGSSGMAYLETSDGVESLDLVLNSGLTQVSVICGNSEKIRRFLGLDGIDRVQAEKSKVKKTVMVSVENKALQDVKSDVSPEDRLENDLKKIVSAVSLVPLESLDVNENLGETGFDSIMLKELGGAIGEEFGVDLPPTVFFAYSTVRGLAGHLGESYPEILNRYKGKTQDVKLPAFEKAEVNFDGNLNQIKKRKRNRSYQMTGQSLREPVAIIGINGIFPGSPDMDTFWNNLESCGDMITEIPPDRWDWRDYYSDDPSEPNKTNAKWGGFIDDIDKFDAEFFNISPREAELMDPQHRLFLQTSWKTIEDAGYRASELSGKNIGVFAGVQFSDYQDILSGRVEIQPQFGTGNAHAMLANRVSYFLNFRGPSETIDTACSSALVALHRAVKSVQSGESELAIAGGVSLMISPYTFLGAAKLGILSPDGRCKTFDRKANGYVKGEGVGAVLVKPLSKAEEDGDYIYAVIAATVEAHGGKANSLTAPNSEAQAAMLLRAYGETGFSPDTLTYMEVHGTGTELGDPVEVQGLKKAFAEMEAKEGRFFARNYCGLGSVKTNIGHLEPAAGIAGIMKILLSMKHGRLPGTVHLKEVNPYIDLEGSPFYIVEKTKNWERIHDENGREIPRRAGVSSFGFGGSYAHAVLEEYEFGKHEKLIRLEKPHLIVLSAKNGERLLQYARDLASFIEKEKDASIFDVAYTLQTGREEMDYRLAFTAKNITELSAKLDLFIERNAPGEGIYCGHVNGTKNIDIITEYGSDNFEDLCDRWTRGALVDWKRLYNGIIPRRIPLPSYPFAKERYWIDENENIHSGINGTACEINKVIRPCGDINVSDLNDENFETIIYDLLTRIKNGEISAEEAEKIMEEVK